MTPRRVRAVGALGAALLLLLAEGTAHARTVEVHLVTSVDLKRVQPSGPADEPIEPAPAMVDRAREVIGTHPAFRDVTLRVVASEVPPNPRVPADFLRLVDQRVDDVMIVRLTYQMRLDAFRASGLAAVRGFVAVYNVAARRQVLSRSFTATAAYPGDVTREAVLQAELQARARGTTIPVEQIELALLDGAVKQRLPGDLSSALGIYHPPSLPQISARAVQEGMELLARYLAQAPDRRAEAAPVIEQFLKRYPEAPTRSELGAQLVKVRQTGADPSHEAQRQQERETNRVTRTVTAAELAQAFERLVGSVVEVRSFKLWQEADGAWMRTPDKRQDFVVEQCPTQVWELPADPPALYVMVVGRRPDPRFVDVKVPVVRWVGCPKTTCPPRL